MARGKFAKTTSMVVEKAQTTAKSNPLATALVTALTTAIVGAIGVTTEHFVQRDHTDTANTAITSKSRASEAEVARAIETVGRSVTAITKEMSANSKHVEVQLKWLQRQITAQNQNLRNLRQDARDAEFRRLRMDAGMGRRLSLGSGGMPPPATRTSAPLTRTFRPPDPSHSATVRIHRVWAD